MESFGPLLERDIVRVQLEQLETVLLKYLNDDFLMVKTEFDQFSKKEKSSSKEQGKETFSTRIIELKHAFIDVYYNHFNLTYFKSHICSILYIL